MPDPRWGRDDVLAHLTKVREHYGILSVEQMPIGELLMYLERYDVEVEPLTQEQAHVVSQYLMVAIDLLVRRN